MLSFFSSLDPNVKQTLKILVGFSAFCLAKSYFSGGQCHIDKKLNEHYAILTGGNTGIGKKTAKRLVQLGCNVIIGARDIEKNKQTVDQLKQLNLGDIQAYHLDLASKQSIQEFAAQVKQKLGSKPIDFLINNAGVMMIPEKIRSSLGSQMQMAINHLGHFYLTSLLWSKLKQSEQPRIINVSSKAHKRQKGNNYNIDFHDFGFQNSEYSPMAAYSRSKKANILFSKQLQKRMNDKNIKGLSLSLHPGVVRTQLGRYFVDTILKKIVFTVLFLIPSLIFMKSSKQGAQTTLYTLLQDFSKLEGGQYYSDCKKHPIQSDQCLNKYASIQLWEASQAYWNINFDL